MEAWAGPSASVVVIRIEYCVVRIELVRLTQYPILNTQYETCLDNKNPYVILIHNSGVVIFIILFSNIGDSYVENYRR